MDGLFHFPTAIRHDEAIDEWLSGEPHVLFAIARQWFNQLRSCGDDVNELMHDGCATACVGDVAFAYVGVYRTHVNVGFFNGASLSDRHKLLEGSGQRMRHVKIRPGEEVNVQALGKLIEQAYQDMQTAIQQGR